MEKVSEACIVERENALRDWFTRDCPPIQKVIDGLDIGWGGIERWATARIPLLESGRHLDFACGYATFLAELGWRFPSLNLVGLNIDYEGPHALAPELLRQAGVYDRCLLVRADARDVPFPDACFDSVSCFLGLQDIEIGFGEEGVRTALTEAVRVLHSEGTLTLIDEFPFDRFERLLDGIPVEIKDKEERALDVRWERGVAERAIELYAEGWVAQERLEGEAAKEKAYREAHARMKAKMEKQLAERGYYVPFGPMQMVIVRGKSRDTA
jgi:ubiquinone/menaquinone biosynthesis C-methylase UbiE